MKRVLNAILTLILALSFCSCGLNSTYNDTHEYHEPQIDLLLEEAYGNSAATKHIFDFAEEIGYCPSSVFGPYCFDMRTHTVHNTDSACVKQIPPESLLSCWVYDCYTLQSVKKTIKENQFLSTFDWEICPICVP